MNKENMRVLIEQIFDRGFQHGIEYAKNRHQLNSHIESMKQRKYIVDQYIGYVWPQIEKDET